MQVFKNNVSLEATPTGDTHIVNKAYLEDRISKINVQHAVKVDELPICTDNGDGTYTITYIKDGDTKTTTDISQWFYYLDDNGNLKQTIFLDGEELTIDGAEIALDDYVEKSAIVTTLDDTVTDEQIPTAKVVYDGLNDINQFAVQEVTTAGTDLNDYTTTGIYMFNSAYCPTNIPAGVNGWLIVMPGGTAVKQLWFRYGTANVNSYETYERTYTVSQGWGEWTIYGTSKNSLIFKGYLKDGTDINNILDNGIYNIRTGETIANLPNGAVNGWLIVYKGAGNSSKQIFYRLGTTNKNDFETYIRTGNSDGSTWSDWSMQCVTKTFNKSATALTLRDSTNFTLHESADIEINCSYSIKNGICQVNIDIDCLVASSVSNIFNESLPEPYSGKYMANILPLYLNSTSADASYRPITLIVVSGGTSIIYGGTVGGRYFGSFSYPVADDWRP